MKRYDAATPWTMPTQAMPEGVGVFWTWHDYTNGLLLVIVFLLAGILFVLATRKESR